MNALMSKKGEPITAAQWNNLLATCREIARMKHPSIERLLRDRGFCFEADRIAELVQAVEAFDGIVVWD